MRLTARSIFGRNRCMRRVSEIETPIIPIRNAGCSNAGRMESISFNASMLSIVPPAIPTPTRAHTPNRHLVKGRQIDIRFTYPTIVTITIATEFLAASEIVTSLNRSRSIIVRMGINIT